MKNLRCWLACRQWQTSKSTSLAWYSWLVANRSSIRWSLLEESDSDGSVGTELPTYKRPVISLKFDSYPISSKERTNGMYIKAACAWPFTSWRPLQCSKRRLYLVLAVPNSSLPSSTVKVWSIAIIGNQHALRWRTFREMYSSMEYGGGYQSTPPALTATLPTVLVSNTDTVE